MADAQRVVLNYRAGDVTLEEVIYLDKLLPPTDELPEGGPEGELSGFWFELRDGSDSLLYRQIESNPLVRVWSEPIEEGEESGRGLRRRAAVVDDTTFTFLVPRIRSEGAHVVIYTSPLDAVAEGIGVPAEPRWRIDLPAGPQE